MGSVLDQIAYYQGRRDEVPNQELARRLAETRDRSGIGEIAANLHHANPNVQSDCLKVLYKIGYISPPLVADYAGDFLALLTSRRNRMVWGAMIGLATIAALRPREIWSQIDLVVDVTAKGTVITQVWGVRVLAQVAAADDVYHDRLWPVLLDRLRTCIPRDVPTHAESLLGAVREQDVPELAAVLAAREPEMTASQRTRLRRVARQLPSP
jgi:hypothetical protein